MTERHFFLEQGYLVRIRSYGSKREWAVYQDGLPYGPWFGTGSTVGSLKDAKRAAHAALNRTLSAAENPIGTKTVLLGVAALGALAAVFYAVNASAKPAALTTGSSPPPGGSMAISLTSADSGYGVNAAVGDGISIALPAVASGQQWTATDQQNNVLTLQGNNGTSVVYTAANPGQDTITLTLIDSTGPVAGTAPLTFPITVASSGATLTSGSGSAPLNPSGPNESTV